jgi:hypothetical protein
MEVKIGVIYTAKELVVDMADDADSVRGAIEGALSGSQPVLWLTDDNGRRVGVPTDKIAYVELGSEESTHPVGFGRGR